MNHVHRKTAMIGYGDGTPKVNKKPGKTPAYGVANRQPLTPEEASTRHGMTMLIPVSIRSKNRPAGGGQRSLRLSEPSSFPSMR